VCGVSECDREASIIKRPWPTRGCYTTDKFVNISKFYKPLQKNLCLSAASNAHSYRTGDSTVPSWSEAH
jgi:hypothetical protein